MSPEAGQEALAALERVEPNLRGILQWFRIPQDDAQDLRQEILLSLVRCWDRIESPEGWLISALFRICRRYHGMQSLRYGSREASQESNGSSKTPTETDPFHLSPRPLRAAVLV